MVVVFSCFILIIVLDLDLDLDLHSCMHVVVLVVCR